MDKITYADSIGNVSINNGMVRLDFYRTATSAEATHKDGEQDEFVFSRQVVMPLVGFVQSFPLLYDLIKKLEEAGVISVNQQPSS